VPLFFLLERPVLAVAMRWAWFRRYRLRVAERSRGTLARYGVFIGLAIFVAIPFPGTGAYTGCILAELLHLDRGRAAAAISVGVVGACVMVFLVSIGVIRGVLARWF